MPKTKFTPAPWHVTRHNDLQYSISQTETGYEEKEISDEEDKANANIIEAAPLLLELLQKMVEEYSPFMDIPENYKELKGWPGDENPRMVVVMRSLDLIEKLNNL